MREQNFLEASVVQLLESRAELRQKRGDTNQAVWLTKIGVDFKEMNELFMGNRNCI